HDETSCCGPQLLAPLLRAAPAPPGEALPCAASRSHASGDLRCAPLVPGARYCRILDTACHHGDALPAGSPDLRSTRLPDDHAPRGSGSALACAALPVARTPGSAA